MRPGAIRYFVSNTVDGSLGTISALAVHYFSLDSENRVSRYQGDAETACEAWAEPSAVVAGYLHGREAHACQQATTKLLSLGSQC